MNNNKKNTQSQADDDILNLLIHQVDLENLEKLPISPKGAFCIPNLAMCPSLLNYKDKDYNDLLKWVFKQITEVQPTKFKRVDAIVLFDLTGIRGRFDIPNNDYGVYCLLNLEPLYQIFIYKRKQ